MPKSSSIPSLSELFHVNTFRLPRLPIPALENTVYQYLESCKAFAPIATNTSTASEAHGAFNARLVAHIEKLNRFLSTSGPEIQRLLTERDAVAAERGEYPFSFVEKLWDSLYLDDDGSIPFSNSVNMVSKALNPSWSQSRVAAKVARACAKWFIVASDGSLPPPPGKSIYICMTALANQFGLARKPGLMSDEKTAASSMTEALRYVTVVCKGQVFLVSMVDAVGQLRSEDCLNSAFTTVLEHGKDTGPSSSIPIMTTANRREWFRTRCELHAINSANSTNLKLIDHSLIVLCLDSDPVSSVLDMQYKLLTGSSPDAMSQTPTAARNRWFDKHQLVIPCSPGKGFGFIAEHSFSDGMMWWTWLKDVYNDVTSEGLALSDPSERTVVLPAARKIDTPSGRLHNHGVVQLEFSLNASVRTVLYKTLDRHIAAINNLNVGLTTLPASKDESKNVFKMSFDSLCLATVQLALARKHGFMAATYKPASTGKFFHGRTETVRSATPAMHAFIRAFLDDSLRAQRHGDIQVVALLRAATAKHRDLSAAAASGAGIDRHLCALKAIAKEVQDRDALALFDDDLFKQSSTWTLSTTTNVEPYLDWGSFCPVTPTGYGVSLFWRQKAVNVSVTSYKDARNCEMKINAVELAGLIGKTWGELMALLRRTILAVL